jgi:hypothetical protein
MSHWSNPKSVRRCLLKAAAANQRMAARTNKIAERRMVNCIICTVVAAVSLQFDERHPRYCSFITTLVQALGLGAIAASSLRSRSLFSLLIGESFHYNAQSMPFLSWARIAAGCLAIIMAVAAPRDLHAQSTLIPVTTRRDLVFDHSGTHLYITTSDGFVRPYNLSTHHLETAYNLGGSLWGADIAPDDSFLLIAQDNTANSQGTFHKLNLNTRSVINIRYPLAFGEAGGWAVAIGSNGLALVTTQFGGSGWTPLRQIDLATNAVSIRTDATGSGGGGQVRGYTQTHRSADRTRCYFMESGDAFVGPIFTYSAVTNTFGPSSQTSYDLSFAAGAVNRNGTLLASRGDSSYASLDTAPELNFARIFNGITYGVAFDAVTDTFYGVSTDQIIAYDTDTFAEKFRLNIGENMGSDQTFQFGTGRLVASADGRHLALETPSGVRLFTVPPGGPTPTPSPGPATLTNIPTRRGMVFDHSGRHLYIATSDGFVWPYNLLTGHLERAYNLGGWLNGVDIAPDDSFLLIAQYDTGVSQGAFHKLDLTTGAVTNINYTRTSGEIGALDVAIGSNGLALVTTQFYGSGETPVRQIDPATNAITIRAVPGRDGRVTGDTQIHRSADRTRFYFMEGDDSSGSVFTYSAVTNTFGPMAQMNAFLYPTTGAVNRDGTLLATRLGGGAFLATVPHFNLAHIFNEVDRGVAFDAVRDTLYGVNSVRDEIVGYDTHTFAQRFRLYIGENLGYDTTRFGAGTLVASADGRHVALATPSGVRLFIPAPTPTPGPATLRNISTRLQVGTDDEVAIAGFIVQGNSPNYPKRVLIRAEGPSLANFGISNVLPNPRLELHSGSTIIAMNDDWLNGNQVAEIISSGLAPGSPIESALIVTLPPGSYTAVVQDVNGFTGVGLVEVYDLSPTSGSLLANLSTRGFVQTGEDVMIGGFIVVTQPTRVIIRAIGPSLTQFGVPAVLANPTLELHDHTQALIGRNDDWQRTQIGGIIGSDQVAEIRNSGLAPTNPAESAIIATLQPGNYTAIVRGVNGTTGTALVEVYDLQ